MDQAYCSHSHTLSSPLTTREQFLQLYNFFPSIFYCAVSTVCRKLRIILLLSLASSGNPLFLSVCKLDSSI
ncbi:Hypothetical predicted protein [Cloeon dipterum]|uniref:Uncharacterized protein n=1 Tax=Cloeon dipterum TaxID=197152 RepID=A0A8S1DKR2_9INSE|nr:Hypothetical predicted protein [Cloeon dipterum]